MSQSAPAHPKFPVASGLKITELYPWQKQVIEICSREPTTTCHWYWGPIIGKTALAHYLVDQLNAFIIRSQATKLIRQSIGKDRCKILIFHPTFAIRRVPYEAITHAMDGALVINDKGMARLNPPHVFVFSNHPPDREKISEWKWHVQHISSPEQEPDAFPAQPEKRRAAHQPTSE